MSGETFPRGVTGGAVGQLLPVRPGLIMTPVCEPVMSVALPLAARKNREPKGRRLLRLRAAFDRSLDAGHGHGMTMAIGALPPTVTFLSKVPC